MFTSGLPQEPIHRFPDWSTDGFEVVRSWIYTGDISRLSANLFASIWAMADYLLVDGLKESCLEYISTIKFERKDCYDILAALEPSFSDLNIHIVLKKYAFRKSHTYFARATIFMIDLEFLTRSRSILDRIFLKASRYAAKIAT
jgi:hypothetical protein